MLGVLRTKIIDYYDALIDEVDNRAKALAVEEFSQMAKINERRDTFTKELKSLETTCLREFYLTNLGHYRDLDEDATDMMIFKTFSFLVNKDDMTLDNMSNIDATFGYLVVIDRHLTVEKMLRYREFLGYTRKKRLAKANSFLNLRNEVILQI
jgi:hypothetical protein